MGNGKSCTSQTRLCAPDKLLPRHLIEEHESSVLNNQSHAAHSMSSGHPVIQQLIVHCNEKLDDVIFLIKKGSVLRFILGPSLCSSKVRLFINHQFVGIEEDKSLYEVTWHKKHVTEFGSFSDLSLIHISEPTRPY